MSHRPTVLLLTLLAASASFGAEVTRAIEVEPVWSGHPVGFCLLTHGDRQLIAYYDADRQMTIAQRSLDKDEWTIQKLPRRTGWDSHNYITMAIDSQGHLHVTGDMHVDPLVYFRTTRPMDITSLEPVHRMVGEREDRVTYPRFIEGRDGDLIFRYRDGSSGKGDDLYNVYDPGTRQWKRLLATPLISGEGRMNAYCSKPQLGPDGRFHMVWVWRDTPDAATNHHVSYARSDDLVNWETSAGQPLQLPITLATGDVVDPIPPGGGVINGNVRLGFDNDERPVVTYHKYDEEGNTQIYAARREKGGWVIYRISDWDYRWEFGGGGSIEFDVRVGGVEPIEDGRLALAYGYPGGSGTWVLDARTMKPIPGAKAQRPPGLPRGILKVESEFPGMQKRVEHDSGEAPAGKRYVMTWETLGRLRDHPRPEPWPEPSMLRVIEIREP